MSLCHEEQKQDPDDDPVDAERDEGMAGNEFEERLDADYGEYEGRYETDQDVLPISKDEGAVVFVDVIGRSRKHRGQRQQKGELGRFLPVDSERETAHDGSPGAGY